MWPENGSNPFAENIIFNLWIYFSFCLIILRTLLAYRGNSEFVAFTSLFFSFLIFTPPILALISLYDHLEMQLFFVSVWLLHYLSILLLILICLFVLSCYNN